MSNPAYTIVAPYIMHICGIIVKYFIRQMSSQLRI